MSQPIEAFAATIKNPYTRRQYAHYCGKFLAYCSTLEKEPAQEWVEQWVASVTTNRGSGNVMRSAVKAYLRYIGKPVDAIRMEDYNAPMQTVVDWDAARKPSLDRLEKPRDRAFIALLFDSWLRWEGMRNLTWAHVDFLAHEAETVEKRGISRTKDSRLGPVMLTQRCVDELQAYFDACHPKPKPADRVFPFSYRTALRITKRALALPPENPDEKRTFGLHSVRRGAASAALLRLEASTPQEAMDNFMYVSQGLSHLNPATTATYLYLDRKQRKETFRKLMEE